MSFDIPSNDDLSGILLVGNGRSLLNRRGFGTMIDSYPVVVRFNNFVTTGFEPFVGRKMNWWARAENPDILPRTEPLQRIFLRLQGEDPEKFRARLTELIPDLSRQYPGVPIDVIPSELFIELGEEYGFTHAPLTGTLVIAHLLKTLPQVHICGFDNLHGTAQTLRHYFSDQNIIGDWTTYHEPDKESAYIQRQISQGRVVKIDE